MSATVFVVTIGDWGMIGDVDGQNLIFLAGCPRSGTTYLQKMLAALPNTKTSQELHLWYLVNPLWNRWCNQGKAITLDQRGGVGLALFVSQEDFLAHFRNFLIQLLEEVIPDLQPGEMFIEKTPSNALFIDLIHTVFPKAKVVYVLRDARDVVASLLAASTTWGKHWAPGNPKEAAKRWQQYSVRARSGLQDLPDNLHITIKYEEMIADPVARLRGIAAFLAIDASDHQIMQAVQTNSLDSVHLSGGTVIHRGIVESEDFKEPEGFVRKVGDTRRWRDKLSFYQRFWVWRVARKEMKEVGYEWKWPW
ncbi:MAG: sulfotransferase [Deltaproteobacteria bacterium]|nr:sulfotransferase [Deltaproteobacteria bacterium]